MFSTMPTYMWENVAGGRVEIISRDRRQVIHSKWIILKESSIEEMQLYVCLGIHLWLYFPLTSPL